MICMSISIENVCANECVQWTLSNAYICQWAQNYQITKLKSNKKVHRAVNNEPNGVDVIIWILMVIELKWWRSTLLPFVNGNTRFRDSLSEIVKNQVLCLLLSTNLSNWTVIIGGAKKKEYRKQVEISLPHFNFGAMHLICKREEKKSQTRQEREKCAIFNLNMNALLCGLRKRRNTKQLNRVVCN